MTRYVVTLHYPDGRRQDVLGIFKSRAQAEACKASADEDLARAGWTKTHKVKVNAR
jgi:hypothetical protein